jgi:O-antigen/teichoic acid export membrane protein
VRPAGIGEREIGVIAAGVVVASLLVGGYAVLVGLSRFRRQAAVTATAPWIYVVLLVGLWQTMGLTVARAGVAWVATLGVWAVLLLAAAVRDVGLGTPDARLLRESLSFGVRAWGGGVFRFLNLRLDQLLMGFISTEAALGIYAVAVNASEVLLYLPTSAALALLPLVSSSDVATGARLALRVFRALVVVTVATAATAAAVVPFLIPFLFGEAFRASILPFWLLMPGAIGLTALLVFSNALVGSLSPGRASLGPVSALATGVALDLVLIPRYGAAGAAAAASAAFLVGGSTALWLYRRRVGFAWTEVVPHRGDVSALWALVRARLRPKRQSGLESDG